VPGCRCTSWRPSSLGERAELVALGSASTCQPMSPFCSRSTVAPASTSGATARTVTSQWTRFFTVFGSGTGTKSMVRLGMPGTPAAPTPGSPSSCPLRSRQRVATRRRMPGMRVGIGLPAAVPGAAMTMLGRWSAEAERAGFSSVEVIDRLVYQNLDPLVALAAAAACTSRVELVTTVVNVCWRGNAMLLAGQVGRPTGLARMS
jgi:hypothetical protein